MRAAIYARYSTDNQSARSVDDQIALCKEHATRLGYVVVSRYSDSAISGQTTAQRPGFMSLMAAVRRPKGERPFDVIVVENADRLSRDPGDLHAFRKLCVFHQVRVEQVSGGEMTATSAAVTGLLSSLTIQQGIEKTLRGMTMRAAEGLRMGGRLYGYDPLPGVERGRVVINPAQAAVVKRIFAMFLAGESPRAIAGRLNAEGIPGPRGPKWNASAIGGWGKRGNGILGNEAYCGVAIFGKVKMWRDPDTGKRISRPNPRSEWKRVARPDLAIIAPEVFAEAQQRRRGPQANPRKKVTRHLLSGLLRCPCCGGGMSIKDGRDQYRRVVCTTFRESGSCTNGTPFNMTRIERTVVDHLHRALQTPDLIRVYVEEYNAARRERLRTATDTAAKNRAELTKVEGDLERAAAAVINGVMTASTAAPHIARLEARKLELEGLLRTASTSSQPLTIDIGVTNRYRRQLANLVTEITAARATGNSEAATAFRQLVTTVTVHRNYELDIAGDLAPLVGGGSVVAGEGFEQNPPERSVLRFMMKAA